MKMFLISDNVDTQTGMRLVGIEGVVVHEVREILEAIQMVIEDKEIGVCLITEVLEKIIKNKLDDIKLEYSRPLFVVIPDRHGTIRTKDSITKYVREAIGLKI